MRWRMLIPFPQMSSLRVKKLCCMCLKTAKQWSKCSLKEGVPQRVMFPRPTDLRSIGCLIELIWTPKSKSKTSTPKTNSQTFWQKGISRAMSGIICCACSILPIAILHSCNDERISTRFRRRTNHNKIETNDESCCQDAIVRVFFNFSESGEDALRKSRSMEISWWKKRSRPLGKETDSFEVSDRHYHEQFMENFSSTDYSKLDYDRAWSSQEWKTETTTYDRSRRPDKTFWRMARKIRPRHEEIVLDRTAQSTKHGETLRDDQGDLIISILKK